MLLSSCGPSPPHSLRDISEGKPGKRDAATEATRKPYDGKQDAALKSAALHLRPEAKAGEATDLRFTWKFPAEINHPCGARCFSRDSRHFAAPASPELRTAGRDPDGPGASDREYTQQ